MTAQVTVMNKEAIALASDSAATITDGCDNEPIKIMSCNKLFALSKCHQVGIMTYGDHELMGVPIETILGIYGKHLGEKPFDTLGEYVTDFIKFLENGNNLIPETIKRDYAEEQIASFYQFIKGNIEAEIKKNEESNRKLNKRDLREAISRVISQQVIETSEAGEKVPGISKSHIALSKKQYADIIDESVKEIFKGLSLSRYDLKQIKDKTPYIISNYYDSADEEEEFGKDSTSIVFAGFGEKDIFPRLKTLDINGIVANKLIYAASERENIEETSGGQIAAFAQADMVCAFMNGIDPNLWEYMFGHLEAVIDLLPGKVVRDLGKYSVKEKQLLRDQLKRRLTRVLNDYERNVEKWSQEENSNDILTVVKYFSQGELASMAETLVNLTSFKRKVTVTPETVSEPIDVAVISKSDGFIWIKRKSYFSPECN